MHLPDFRSHAHALMLTLSIMTVAGLAAIASEGFAWALWVVICGVAAILYTIIHNHHDDNHHGPTAVVSFKQDWEYAQ